MSDTGRKGIGEQIKEKATLQEQKVLSCFVYIGAAYCPTLNKPEAFSGP